MELCQNYTARSFGGNEILHRIVYEYHLSEVVAEYAVSYKMIQEYLSKAKKFALKMNESVHRLIPQLPWLTDTVKAFALARADNLTFVIGNHSDFLPAGFNLKDWFDLVSNNCSVMDNINSVWIRRRRQRLGDSENGRSIYSKASHGKRCYPKPPDPCNNS